LLIIIIIIILRRKPTLLKALALIFDCDGVLADTERDGHRVAFNRAFQEKGYTFTWDVDLYGELLKVSGGKERMRHYFIQHGWPNDVKDQQEWLQEMHKLKTGIFTRIIESGQLPARSGVKRLVDEALAEGVRLAVCSTSNERAVVQVVETLLGLERKQEFLILAGDIVTRKKPDPEIYSLAKERLGLKGSECVVIEDSRNGLLAAKAALMHCLVTISHYTKDEDFAEADAVVPELGDPPDVYVTLEELKRMAG